MSTAHGVISIGCALMLRSYWVDDTIPQTRTHPMQALQLKNMASAIFVDLKNAKNEYSAHKDNSKCAKVAY